MSHHIWIDFTDIFDQQHLVPYESISSLCPGSFPGSTGDVTSITLQGSESFLVAGTPQGIYAAVLPQIGSTAETFTAAVYPPST